MAPINPYLRNKQKPVASEAKAPSQAASNGGHTFKSTGNTAMTTVPKPKAKSPAPSAISKSHPSSVEPNKAPELRPAAPTTVTPKSRPSAVGAIAGSVSTQPKKPAPASMPPSVAKRPIVPFSSLSKPRKSFKSKLKDEIEALKRAKQLEKQRKQMEKQQKQLEKQRQEELAKQQQATSGIVQQQASVVSLQQAPIQQSRQPAIPSTNVPPMTTRHERMPMTNAQRSVATVPTNYITPAKGVVGREQSVQKLASTLPSSLVKQVTPASIVQAIAAAPNVSGGAVSTPASSIPNSSQSTVLNERSKMNETTVSQNGIASVPRKVAISKTPNEATSASKTIVEGASDQARLNSDQVPAVDYSIHDALAAVPYDLPQGPVPYIPPYHAALSTMLPQPPPTPIGYIPPFGYHPYQQAMLMMGHQPWSQAMGRVLPPAPSVQPTIPRQVPSQPTPSPKTAILHRNPLHPVSPYSSSHSLVDGEVVIYKNLGESFGVSFKYEEQSVLVEPEVIEALSGMLSSAPSSVTNPTVGENTERNATLNAGSESGGKENSKSNVGIVHQSKELTAAVHSTSVGSQATSPASAPTQSTHVVKQRKPRRRRVFFGVLTAVSADKQNDQFKSDDPARQLQPGDIILKIDGRDLGGLTFQQAIEQFASCDTIPSDRHESPLIRCPLVVARRKATSRVPSYASILGSSTFGTSAPLSTNTPTPKVPFAVNTITDQIHSGDFTSAEVAALAEGIMGCISTESRSLGQITPLQVAAVCLQQPGLIQRDISSIKAKRNHFVRSSEQSMKESASAHWSSQWKIEQEKMEGSQPSPQLANLSDAERSALRELPRPLKGCRCGGTDHEYVNDSKCVLYRNLRMLSETPAEPSKANTPTVPKKTKSSNLNAMATACKDRILKLKEVTGREEDEARFVERMEELQVKKVKMAVFAPSLTAMVLSSVAEVAKGLSRDELIVERDTNAIAIDKDGMSANKTESLAKKTSKIDVVVDDDDDSDDDDDIPLMALGKRNDALSVERLEAKRLKVDGAAEAANATDKNEVNVRPSLDLLFLAKVLRHVSQTWGYIYTEPSDADYSWRWEVHHGQTASGDDGYRETRTTNPRPVGSRSFENIRFSLTNEVVHLLASSTTSKPKDAPAAVANARLLMSHLLSPERTGVYDEIMALVSMGVLQRTKSGCVALANDWEDHVDPLILNDMELHWSKRKDPMNKHCMSKAVRDKLERTWTRAEHGWAMSVDCHDVIFRDDEWDEWQTHFQSRFNSRINEAEGIEKFGI